MKKKLSKRYKKLLELSKDRKKVETLEEAIKKVKKGIVGFRNKLFGFYYPFG